MWPAVAVLLLPALVAAACPETSGVFDDMHDGDQKQVEVKAGMMTIRPYANHETWRVSAAVDATSCTALVDFNVPGKPGPPPCRLVATLFEMSKTSGDSQHFLEFSDPADACKFGAPGTPLNTWVQHSGTPPQPAPFACPSSFQAVVYDMSDGDQKTVDVHSGTMTILPHGNKQTWRVSAAVDATTCSAVVDFNVPGKPGPPPCNLTATLWGAKRVGDGSATTVVEWTDPDDACKFGDPGSALNAWVEFLETTIAV